MTTTDKYQTLYLNKFQIKRSFHEFLHSSSTTFHIHFYKSTFNSFTNHVVNLEANPLQKIRIDSTMIIKEKTELEMELCKFQKVQATDDGGALKVTNNLTTVKLTEVGFLLCQSEGRGGSCFFDTTATEFDRCCLQGCLALERGQSVFSGGIGHQNFVAKALFYDQCSPIRSQGDSVAFFIFRSIVDFDIFNSTKNHVVDIGASLCIAYNHFCSIKYGNVWGSSGSNIMWFNELSHRDQLAMCNFVSNKARNNGILAFEQSEAIVDGFIFIDNEATTYLMLGEVTMSNCLFDVKNRGSFVSHCKASFIEPVFGHNRLRPREIPEITTWRCMNLGRPSPTPSKSLVPIEAKAEEAALGITVMAVLLGIGIGVGAIAYFLFGKMGDSREIGQSRVMSLVPN